MPHGISGTPLITQRAQIGKPRHPGILKLIMNWPEGQDFRLWSEEEVTCAEEAALYDQFSESEKKYGLFIDGSWCIIGKHWRQESRSIGSAMKSCRNYWRRRWVQSVCRGESHPAGFRYCWMGKMANTLPLYWFRNDDKCPVEVVAVVEAE